MFALILPVFLCFLSWGCSLPENHTIEILLPLVPEHLENIPGRVAFCLKIPGYSNDEFCTLAPGSIVSASVSASIMPVVAVPVFSIDGAGFAELYCGGGIFPADVSGGVLELTWENGFAAQAAYRAVCGGALLENFNLQRFKSLIMEKSGGNPWTLSEELIIYSLYYRIFNLNYLKKKETRSFKVLLKESSDQDSKWYYLNPLDSRSIRIAEGELLMENIPERNISVVSASGDKFIDFIINSEGWCAFFRPDLYGISGSW